MSRKNATGRKAYYHDERDGLRKPYRKMVKDGYNKGLKVSKDTYDPKEPQEQPFRNINDPQSLKDGTGDVDRGVQFLKVVMREFKNQVGDLAPPMRLNIQVTLSAANVVML